MKIKLILLSLTVFFNIVSCNGQDKKESSLISNTNNTKTLPSIIDNFSKVQKLYFDSEKKLIFSTLFNNSGKFTVYYIPNSSEDIRYYDNFESNNNIKPLYDELNSSYYYSQDDQKKIDKILHEKIKSDKNFKIIGTYIPKEFVTIENKEEYYFSFPYSQKYYQKNVGKWNFILEKKFLNANEEISYNSKEFFISLLTNKEKTKGTAVQSNIDGTWKLNCETGVGNIFINNNEASLVVLYNQIYIDLLELKRYDYENGIAYKLKEVPEDIGKLGLQLNWKEYINDEPIAYIKMIDNNTMNFYWYGFYNNKTKKREFKEINFNQETKNQEIILKKCAQ